MSNARRSETDYAALADLDVNTDRDVDTDDLFDVVSNVRRRFVVACLDEYATPMALRDVADELATWEHDAPIAEVPEENVRSIYVSLYHVHVPKLAAAGIVEYSEERDAVAPREISEDIVSLVDLPSPR